MRRLNVVETLWKDLQHAVRVLRRSPGFTAIAVVTLALGIGANTAIFSVVNGVLLKPLPFHEPDRLVDVSHEHNSHGPGTYFTYRDNHQVFEDIGAWKTNQVSITGRGEPERVEALSVSDATLPLLRVQSVLGRFFGEEDERPGSPARVVLTHGYWQRKFSGAQTIIGRSLMIDGMPSEIVGVLPASLKFLRTDPAVLLPMQIDRAKANNGSFDFQVLARLKPGVTLSQANADVARMIPLLPPTYHAYRLQPNIRPLAQDVIGDIGRILWILLATVGFVLLIACANVANLFLVRAEGRQQELAIRAALGASRGRIARELLSESLMLALAGGVVGLALAQASIGVLRRLAPAELPRVDEINIDPMVLLFTVAISVLTGLMFGLIPVLRFGTPSGTALKEGGRSASDAPGRHRTRNALVVAEVALALVLLIVSGLMIRTFVAMRQVEPGFVRPHEVQTFRIDVPEALVSDLQQMARTHDEIAQRLRQVPGVVSVGLSSSITMDGENNTNAIHVEHVHVRDDELPPHYRFKSVAPGYFETMGNRLVAGRTITWTDIYQVRPVVVISETLAREYWREPSEALGKRVRNSLEWREIVGVVGNERDDGLNQPATAMVYWPLLNENLWVRGGERIPGYMTRTMAYAVRSTRVGSPGFLRELQQAVWSVNPSLPLANVQTLDEIQAESMAQTSFAMVMLAIAASVALLLGVVGIYGVIAYIATQRTREIGIRMALGAQTGDVRRLFLRHGLVLTMIGIALGSGAAMLLTRVMSALLFGVGPTDPVTYVAVGASLTVVTLVATYLPARRASRIDPIIALRSDL
ncbi:MAG: FtsX-like permease family protein [Luteitalea sp.]|nr:FtsX-like permease family protein [Luteitalea sp.]